MNITLESIDAIRPSTYNPRSAVAERLDLIGLSLRKLGFIAPIFADSDGEILSGHQRHLVASRMGATHVPVSRTKALDLDQRKAQTNIAKDIAKREGLTDLDLFAGAAVKSLAKKPKKGESASDEYDLFSGNGGAGNRGAFGNPTPKPGGSGTIRGMAGNPDLFDLEGGNAATGLAGGERSGGSRGGRRRRCRRRLLAGWSSARP